MKPFRRSIAASAAACCIAAAGFTQGQDSPPDSGGLSEEEFQKLHSLKPEEAPPARGEMVELEDGSKAYLTVPEGAKPGMPALLVIHEWWGLNSHIKHWADRFTATGRAALAVDLYVGKVATDSKEASQFMRAVDEAKALATMQAGLKFLADDPRVMAVRRASIGWCFGGAMSLKLAATTPELDAAIMYYGRPITDPAQLAGMKTPLLAVFGDRDRSIPAPVIAEFGKALTAAGVPHQIHRFDADHAFANPSGQRYDAKSAAAAWEKVRAFLDEKLPVAK